MIVTPVQSGRDKLIERDVKNSAALSEILSDYICVADTQP